MNFKKTDKTQSLRRTHADLLERAIRQPGVKEVMAVYGEWRKIENATRAHRQIMGMKRIVTASNASCPAFQIVN